jgi:flagellar hook-associated protein 1
MGGLFASLNAGAEALRAFQRSLEVTQNNVSNASTPGYAKQTPALESLPFQPSAGLVGGVRAGDPQSTRDEYLEVAVRYQAALLGNYQAQSGVLSAVEPVFDVSGQGGVFGALNNLFQSFSAWSANPDSTAARQDVLAKAQDVGQSFQQAASTLSSVTSGVNQKIDSTVQQINSLAAKIRDYNVQARKNPTPDAGLDANLHDTLETLSGLTGITTRFESDGTVTVLLGGQTALVIGDQQNSLQSGYFDAATPVNPNGTPPAHILDADGNDVTGQVSGGTLGGLLSVRNGLLPALQGDTQQAGALNELAKHVADRVNQILQSGTTSGASPQPGVALFAYDTSSDANVARSLALDPNATAANLAPVDPGPPAVSNGIALTLAGLGDSHAAADLINGQTILQFYSSAASLVGQQSADATQGQSLATTSLAQAQAFRSQVSGVSLDEEAVRVMELQRGYQAASQLISVVDQLTQTLIDMVQ